MKRYILLLCFCFGCRDNHQYRLSEAMNWLNDPRGIPGANGPLILHVDQLPSSGQSDHRVWVGYWLPYSNGGSLSVMRKYDQLVGNNQASAWEQVQVDRFKNVAWAGKCNGLAAASTMESEPLKSVVYNGVSFDVDDVKTLLIESWTAGGYVVGGRCNNEKVATDANGRVMDPECRDLNPATMHIITTNFLGRWHKPIIVDADGGYQVWNYPVIGYKIVYTQELSKRDANYWLRNIYDDGYPFNDLAVSMRYVQMELSYSVGNSSTFEYILELDANKNILGGEWFRDSRKSHPDFLWRHVSPMAENPYIDVNLIYSIYQRSK